MFCLFRNYLKPFLWLNCGRFHGSVCEVSMACSKHGLRVVWLKSLLLKIVWSVLKFCGLFVAVLAN